ncbi:adenylosuccinate lyase [Phenylobacterium sp.]|jgi:adenylosuccinate lyase|uniref:adenylosuccinate lyase n=1 Tax=Phenylobacterium sp. TaxID=1871053 RepID=UPI002F935C50
MKMGKTESEAQASLSPDPLTAVSPLDGRYAVQTQALRRYFSEFALIRYRLKVEVEWLVALGAEPAIGECRPLADGEAQALRRWVEDLSVEDARSVKAREAVTRHDVKAVEYELRDQVEKLGRADLVPFVHFGCTSEDINNISHALMLRDGLADVWLPAAQELVEEIRARATATEDLPMLAHTHGQPASPTTLGKELAIFVHRLERQLRQVAGAEYLAKFSGAVGNYNAHLAAYADLDWPAFAKRFIEGFGLTQNVLTTQIESHDYMAEVFHALARFNTLLISYDQDMWSYISHGYFSQKLLPGEVGSSTMPHKVNPIDFENSEANAGLANAVLNHLAGKLPISRMQRDLTDSSALRNVGVGVGYALLAVRSALAGTRKVEANPARLAEDLDGEWAVLGEAVQTVLRKAGHHDAYERLKAATQNREFSEASFAQMLAELDIPEDDRARLKAMAPRDYVGLAAELARTVTRR